MSYIPDEIVFIYANSTTAYREVGGKRENTTVTPAFVSDASNPKTIETGIKWAENDPWSRRKILTASQKKIKNEPTYGYKIYNLEVRGQGGRAYKVITPDGFYVDFREDMLLEAIYLDGIGQGGIIKSKCVFAKVGSQMKLILEGSHVYTQIVNGK